VLDISPAGLLGAIAGTAVAGVLYHLWIGALERFMLERSWRQAEADPADMELRLSAMRRTVLTVDLFVFAALGYWLAARVWG
jgi:hypothetical protein